jgi:hypothetical protein
MKEDYSAGWPESVDRRCAATDETGKRCTNDRVDGQELCAQHGGVTDTARTLDKLVGADRSVWMVNGVPKSLNSLTRDERRDLGTR